MKRDNCGKRSAYFIGTCAVAIAAAACANGPSVKGDSTPLVSTVDGMIFEYQLAKSGPVMEDTRPLGNTKWRLTSITPKPERPYAAMFFNFRPDGNLVETATDKDGSLKSDTYRYHIVGSTMIISKQDKDVNARFRMDGNSLIMDTGEYSMLLRRVDDIP
jgi:hypothetical protein